MNMNVNMSDDSPFEPTFYSHQQSEEKAEMLTPTKGNHYPTIGNQYPTARHNPNHYYSDSTASNSGYSSECDVTDVCDCNCSGCQYCDVAYTLYVNIYTFHTLFMHYS